MLNTIYYGIIQKDLEEIEMKTVPSLNVLIVTMSALVMITALILWGSGRAMPELVHALYGGEFLQKYFFIDECSILVTCPNQ